ncbi:MAG: putative DNA-binding domain-containing protein, partial [Acidobacteriales bacterium]|nr:putative DNA-binding domain-containing protein [Terriglobales bacterium]
FPGLQALLGEEKFEALSVAYLSECPSNSYTMRNLGSRLEEWLGRHPTYAGRRLDMALDLVRLEWAEIEAFDLAALPRLTQEDLAHLGEDPAFRLQPYIRLIALTHPMDDWLIKLKHGEDDEHEVASNAFEERVEQPKRAVPPFPRKRKTCLAVHRDQQDLNVYFKRLEPAAFALLQELARGAKLSHAIDSSLSHSGSTAAKLNSQLHDWFQNWSSLGWFCKDDADQRSL